MRDNKGRFKKGYNSPYKGQTKETNLTLLKVSIANSSKHGVNTSMYGRKHSEETKEKMRLARLKNPIAVFKGKKRPNMVIRFLGKNNPNWQGGKSFEPYTPSFNQQLKDRVRTRDNFICQSCGIPELECNRRLSIHHKNSNKKNNNLNNLISLCDKCHRRIHKNREVI